MLKPWVILKFGGSSVADPRHWQTISRVLKNRLDEGYRPLLVLSALKNVSNALEALLHQALAGVHPIALEQLRELHLGFASKLGIDANEILAPWFSSLETFCQDIYQRGQITPQTHAKMLSVGELLSTTIGAHYLSNQSFGAEWMDARQWLISSNHVDLWHHFTSAECNFEYDANLDDKLRQKAAVVVTQGFIACDEQGETVLLGREGSDTSAAYFGAKLKAARVEIWTDVPGVFSANPREIPNARQLPALTYQQAQNMALLGAKVLHPRAIAPAQKNHIPLWVKSTSLPDVSGSVIASHSTLAGNQVMAIAVEPKVSWLGLEKAKNENQAFQVNQKLTSMGFDCIAKFSLNNAEHAILIYRNSDRPQPDDLSLCAMCYLDTNSLRSNLSLISLFGSQFSENDADWMVTVRDYLTKLNVPILQLFHEGAQGQMCILLESKDSLAVSRQLHQQFIESEINSHQFGQSWSTFQD